MTNSTQVKLKIDNRLSALVFHKLASTLRQNKKPMITPDELDGMAIALIKIHNTRK